MSDPGTRITASWKPTDFSDLAGKVKVRSATSSSNGKQLARVSAYISVAAFIIVFLTSQLPEFLNLDAVVKVRDQASELVWTRLPGTGGIGVSGMSSIAMFAIYVGAFALYVKATGVPIGYLTTLAGAALVAVGAVVRIVDIARGGNGGSNIAACLVLLLMAAAAVAGARSAAEDDSGLTGRSDSWRLVVPFLILAVSWLGPVAIGRYIDGNRVVSVAGGLPADDRFHYLKLASSWWFYLIGLIVAGLVVLLAEFLPPWKERSKRLVLATVGIVALVVAFQQSSSRTTNAADSDLQSAYSTVPGPAELGSFCTYWTRQSLPPATIVFSGNFCSNIRLYRGQVHTASLTSNYELSDGDSRIKSGSYGDLVAVPYLAQGAAAPGVVAFGLTDGHVRWKAACPKDSSTVAVRFSGSEGRDNAADGRRTVARGKLKSYVMMDCGRGVRYVVTPLTGKRTRA